MNQTTQTTTQTAEATFMTPMAIIRRIFPSLRRSRPTAIVHSGGKQTVFGCLCGGTHTCATDFGGRDAKHVQEWLSDHADCAERMATIAALPGASLQRRRAGVNGHTIAIVVG